MTLRTGVTATPADDGLVLLDERTGHYWHLNPTGALVLQAESPTEAARALADRYGIPHAQAVRDVTAIHRALHDAGLTA